MSAPQRRYVDDIRRLQLKMTMHWSNKDEDAIRRITSAVHATLEPPALLGIASGSAGAVAAGPDAEAEQDTLRRLMDKEENIELKGTYGKVPDDSAVADAYVVHVYRTCLG